MTAYPPKAVAAVCILMVAEKIYRRMVGLPQDASGCGPQDRTVQGASKNAIWLAYGRIPEPYLRGVRLRIVNDIVAGSLADGCLVMSVGQTRWTVIV